MKKYSILIVALLFGSFSAKAQLSQSEKSQLTAEQRTIYERQYKELTRTIKTAEEQIYKAEDIIKMGEEMKRDNAGTAGAAHVIRGMEMKEKAQKAKREAENELRLLDESARKAIKNNKKK